MFKTYPAKSQPMKRVPPEEFPVGTSTPNLQGGMMEDTSNPYFTRPEMGRSPEEVYRNQRRDYGKNPTPDEMPEGVPVRPKVIHGV